MNWIEGIELNNSIKTSLICVRQVILQMSCNSLWWIFRKGLGLLTQRSIWQRSITELSGSSARKNGGSPEVKPILLKIVIDYQPNPMRKLLRVGFLKFLTEPYSPTYWRLTKPLELSKVWIYVRNPFGPFERLNEAYLDNHVTHQQLSWLQLGHCFLHRWKQ